MTACSAGQQSIALRETLEFRLVQSSSTQQWNRERRSDFERLVALHRQPKSTEEDLRRELLRMESAAPLPNANLFLIWDGSGEHANPHEFVVLGPPLMNCEDLSRVEPRRARGFGGLVFLQFTKNGAAQMRRVTAENIGGQLAIVYRRRVVAAPTIEQTIPYGRAVISNIQTVREAQLIAKTIEACIPKTQVSSAR